MKWLTLEKIKKQCRIEPEFTDEDELLEMYGEAAEDAVLNICNRNITDIYEQYGCVPKPLVQVTLMIVADSYQYRETTSSQNLAPIPYKYDLFLKPYMRLTDSTDINNNNRYGKHCNL